MNFLFNSNSDISPDGRLTDQNGAQNGNTDIIKMKFNLGV